MARKLTFTACAEGRTFGVIVSRGGMATARVKGDTLEHATLAHALLWLERHNPTPARPVELTLVGRFEEALRAQ